MNKTLLLIIAMTASWAAFVMISGLGTHLFGLGWDFHTVAELGEAFGVLGALMAGLAVYFTWQALADERAETKRLRDRESARDIADEIRDRELTFFRMLDLRREILNDVVWGERISISAFRQFVAGYYGLNTAQEYQDRYVQFENDFGYMLNHYFRFSYHIMRFLDETFEFDRAYQYVRIFRAQLSTGEQFMLAVNSIFGAGRDKMLPLINKFGLLHNLEEQFRNILIDFGQGLEAGAFESHSNET